MKVRVIDYSGGETQEFFVLMKDGRVVCPENPVFLELFPETGIKDASGKPVTVADGEAYLRALPIEFSGSYMRAELLDD